jgi:hypothetical protein
MPDATEDQARTDGGATGQYEHRMHFAAQDSVGETGRHERAGADADIDIESISATPRSAFSSATSAPIS